MAGEQSNPRNGYPLPEARQGKFASELTTNVFMSEERWNESRENGNFDYVIIGSSFCAWAFTQRMLENNPKAKILILERGEYYYLEHFENLPPSRKRKLTYESKTHHWNRTEKMQNEEYIKEQDGMNDVFGGQSAFWRGWCPNPAREDLVGWPEGVKDIIEEYFPQAAKLLNVVPADKICKSDGHHYVFGELQTVLMKKIKLCLPVKTVKSVDHASLAVRADKHRCGRIQKTSVADPLLNLLRDKKLCTKEGEQEPLEIKISCVVKKILHEDGKAVALETNKGDVKLGDAKLILAMGVLPPTTLMLNSFPSSSFRQLAGVGTRYTAHFRSSVLARLPRNLYHDLKKKISGKVEVAAMHIPGLSPHSKRQFHIQISAFLDDTPLGDIQSTLHQFPDVLPAPSIEQLSSSKDPPHIIFFCKTIGGLDRTNEKNWFCLNSEVPSNDKIIYNNNTDVTCNTTIQVVLNDTDHQLWDTMDESTFAVLKRLALCDHPDDPCQLEFWHSEDSHSSTQGRWLKDPPPTSQIRRRVLVHPASTMWIGDDESSPVDLNYRFRGVENVYLTGGALWPTAGSWNPTCTMTALAINLADKLQQQQQQQQQQ